MGRPSDWWVLDLDADPTPGDPFRVRELARKFSELSGDAYDAAAEVRLLSGDGGVADWVGEAGRVFAGAIGEFPGQLDKLDTSYGMVGRALTTYAGELETAQGQADGALVRGREARTRLEAARGQVATAEGDATSARVALDTATGALPLTTVPASWSSAPPPPPDPAVVTAATNAHTAAVDHLAFVNGQVTDAQADVDAERRLALAAKSLREGAADTCKNEIDRASDAGIHNRSFWDKAKDFLGKAWDVAVKLAKVVVIVAGIAALIVGGPLAWVVLAAALVVLADTLMRYSDGEASLWDVGFALVDCIPGGRGITTVARLGKGFRAVGAAFRGGRGGVAALRGMAASVRGGLGSMRNFVSNARASGVLAGARRTCGDPVDVVSGETVLGQVDVELPGTLPLLLERTHLSSYRAGHLFGPSWASTLDQRLEVDSEGVCFATVDGAMLVYPTPQAADGPVRPVEGPRWPLTVDDDDDGGTYTVTDPRTGRVLRFAAPDRSAEDITAGFVAVLRLEAVIDRSGDRIDLDYDPAGTLVGVRHGGGYRVAVDTTDGLVTGLRLLSGSDRVGGDRVGGGVVGDGQEAVVPPVTLVEFGYDADGRLSEVVNSSGLPLRFGYDTEGRMISWTDRNGRWYQYVYDEAGRCVRTAGSGGFLSGTFAYGTGSRITVATNSLGHQTTFAYNALGQVVKETDPLGHVTTSEWGRYDWLLSRTDPLDRTTSYTYDQVGNLLEVILPDGSVASAVYDERSRPTVLVHPDGARWERAYDDRGNLVSVTDPVGVTTRYAYDPDRPGHVVAVTDALGHRTLVETNSAGLPTRVVAPSGATTRVGYGLDGRVTSVVDPMGGVSSYTWTVEGKLATHTAPDGTVERWTYDGEGNVVTHVDPAGLVTHFEYTDFDLPSARTSPDSTRLEFGYDTELRLTSVTNPQGLVWTYEYDPAGRLVAETDFDGCQLRYVHDGAGQLVARTRTLRQPLRAAPDATTAPGSTGTQGSQDASLGQTVRFERDVLGDVVAQHTRSGVTRFSFDRAGRLVRAANPDAECILDRDALGRVVAETIDGRTTTSTYDQVGRRVRRVTPSGAESLWSYDADGLPLTLQAGGRVVRFDHDAVGRETERRLDSGLALAQAWDAAHRLISQTVTAPEPTVPGVSVPGVSAVEVSVPEVSVLEVRTGGRGSRLVQRRGYTYSLDGYLTAVDDLRDGVRRYTLDPARRVTAVTGTDWRETYAYDDAGNLAHATWPSGAGRDDGFDTDVQGDRVYAGTRLRRAGKVRYEYDGQGRVTLRQQKRLSKPPRTWRYAWDDEDRLVAVVTPDGQRWRYVYDPLGRRVAKQRVDFDGTVLGQISFAWDGVLLVEQASDAGAEAGMPGLAAGAGALAGGRVVTWEWEPDSFRPVAQLERTLAVAEPSAVATQVAIDRLDMYGVSDADGGGPSSRGNTGDTALGGGARSPDDRDQQWYDTRFYAIVTDLVGTPTELIDPDGVLAWQHRTTLWGVPAIDRQNPVNCPLRFPGQYHDSETGTNYNYHRYYDPTTARYQSTDPLGLAPAPNPVTYVSNPHAWSDPLGLAPCRFIVTPNGTVIDRASIGSIVSAQRQGRHLAGDPLYQGGSYFNSLGDAQRVLDAFHSGAAQVLGTTRHGDVLVRYDGVIGYNNNIRHNFVNQPTNIFFVKGSSSASVVPTSPSARPV